MRFALYLFSILLCCSLSACNKKGCTDCNATNYDEAAEAEDGSCQFDHEDRLGVYSVQDSITGPPSMEWYRDTYELEVTRAACAPHHLIIANYANKNNAFSGQTFRVECKVQDDEIAILDQAVNEDEVRSTTGSFVGDSIYFDIEYENEFGEVFYGRCYGMKK